MHFGGVQALVEVDFRVEEGEIVGLIGANGAGKTTLFSVISGFHSPSSGKVYFRGKNITGMKPFRICRKGLARTFQVVRPFQRMTVLRNVTVGKLFGKHCLREEKKAEQEALEILEFVGLESKAHFPAGSLTMADRKRLELAKALGTDPDLLLLDEVLAGLTPMETAEAMDLVRKVNEQLGITIFMVEHVMKAVVGLCERILVLHYGSKIAEGTPLEIASNDEVIEAYLGEKSEV
jgi:branched-chain amino acid transport system ATP-binding protein